MCLFVTQAQVEDNKEKNKKRYENSGTTNETTNKKKKNCETQPTT